MSENPEHSEYQAILSSSRDCGYLILKNTLSLFDRDLGMPSAKTSLNICFSNKVTGECIIKEFSLPPQAIEVDAQSMGHRIRLDASVNNTLATLVNRVNGRFRASVKEYELADNKVRGEVRYFETLVDDSFDTVTENAKPQTSYVDPAQSAAADSTVNGDVSQSAAATTAAAAGATAATAAAAGGAKSKSSLPLGKILAIAGAFLVFLILAFVAYKLYNSFLGSAAPSVPAQTQEAAAPEPESAEPLKEEESEPESATDEDNGGAQIEPETPASATAPSEPSSESAAQTSVQSDAQSAGAAVSCALSDAEDAAIISSCMSGSADSAALVKLSHDAFAAKRCNLGKRVLSAYGRKNSEVAYAYAQYFDPNSELSSECEQKSKSQAVYWYEKSLELSDNPEAKQALSKLKE